MPSTAVHFYRDERGVPVLDWMKELRAKDRKAYAKYAVRRLKKIPTYTLTQENRDG